MVEKYITGQFHFPNELKFENKTDKLFIFILELIPMYSCSFISGEKVKSSIRPIAFKEKILPFTSHRSILWIVLNEIPLFSANSFWVRPFNKRHSKIKEIKGLWNDL